MKTIAKFEKVSYEEWKRSYGKLIGEDDPQIAEAYENIKLPQRATDGSAGYVFFAVDDITVYGDDEECDRPTGFRCKIEAGYFLQLVPKSGLGTKMGLRFPNTLGIIDSDYYNSDNEGHIQAAFRADRFSKIGSGQKMFQGIFLPYYLAEEETPTAKRNGGHGSTGGT